MSRFSAFINLSCVSIGTFLLIVLTSACVEDPPESFQGYVEGEFVYVAAPIGGRLEELNVRRGQSVTEGTFLFKLEQDFEEGVVQESSETIETARVALREAEENMELAEGRYRTGVGDSIEFADAELILTEAKADLVQERYQYLQAYAKLEHSVGIGKAMERPLIGHKGFSVEAIAKVSR
jgi:multidrug resistance efflux pump